MDKEKEHQHMLPALITVEKGRTYPWCSCGESNTQPLCDKTDCGSKALIFQATLTEDVYFCNCKRSKNPPWCDGSHAELLREYLKKRQG